MSDTFTYEATGTNFGHYWWTIHNASMYTEAAGNNFGGNLYGADERKYAISFRCPSFTVPKGARILTAKLTLYALMGNNLVEDAVIRGDDVDNSPALDSGHMQGDGFVSTSATVNWSPGNENGGSWYDTAEFAAVVQEIIDRAGWSSGGAISIGLDPVNYTQDSGIIQWGGSAHATYKPYLTVTYEASVSLTPPIGSLSAAGVGPKKDLGVSTPTTVAV